MKTNWEQVKCYSFPLSGMTNPTAIMKVVKRLGIKKYTYEIRCSNITIKYGMSDASTTQAGERLYRQIGHLASWPEGKLFGQNGCEFLDIDRQYTNLYNKNMNHNDIVIFIWDFDNYPFVTINTWNEVNQAEIELIENYQSIYNEKPIGNIDDGTQFHRKSCVLKSAWENLIDE